MTKEIIGTVTNYVGTEFAWLKGKVHIVAVCKNGNKPNIDIESPEYAYLTFNSELARFGNVTSWDFIEVEPWIEENKQFSFVTTLVQAVELTCFAYLLKN